MAGNLLIKSNKIENDNFIKITKYMQIDKYQIHSHKDILSCGTHYHEYRYQEKLYHIIYTGILFNKEALTDDVDLSDELLILQYYCKYGSSCTSYFDGNFSFIIYYDTHIFASVDALATNPLYYYHYNDTLIISSQIKAILQYLQKAIVTKEGLLELLALGPCITPGKTIYKDIKCIRPGYYLYFHNYSLKTTQYFYLKKESHNDNYQETIKQIRKLITRNVYSCHDQDIACMLSGGLDSSIVTAILSKEHHQIDTYNVSYTNQDFQHDFCIDKKYSKYIIEKYNTNHYEISIDENELIHALKQSVIARDMPGMADIDASFFVFCKAIKKDHSTIYSGDCADEIFGGYPWFYKEELSTLPHFPWICNIDKKNALYSPLIKSLSLKEYMYKQYQNSLQEINYYEKHITNTYKRKSIYLHYQWFMQTILGRSHTQANYIGVCMRTPFASKDLLQYVYNVPFSYFHNNKSEKSLLKDAFKDILPAEIIKRKKTPFPKPQSSLYTKTMEKLLLDSMQDKDNILHIILDIQELKDLIYYHDLAFVVPWFGQLMAYPQLLAFFYQIYVWAKIYNIQLEI